MAYQKKFDAARYWASKPYCTVCKKHKVKNGSICGECLKAMGKKKYTSKNNIKESSIKDADDFLDTKQTIEDNMSEPNIQQENNFSEDEAPVRIVKTISAEAKNKIVRLFTYLEKALLIDDVVVRDFRPTTAVPSPWWLADFPNDAENLYIRPFDTEKVVENTTQSVAWLRVEKKNVKSAPPLPQKLIEWVNEITPIGKPVAREKIDREVRFDNDDSRVREFKEFRKNFQQGDQAPESLTDWIILSPNKLPEAIEVIYVEDKWAEHLELQKLLKGYTENEWELWADKVRKVYKANLLYDQLYALRLLLKNEGDNYEFLLGQGLLTWKHKSVGSIYAPVFLTPLTLDFDASKRVIEISPDPMFRGFAEVSSLYETDNPAEMDLITWSDKINANPFDFWHLESLKIQSRTLVNYISTDSEENFVDEISSAPTITEHPSIWNAPVIFARKRNNDLWSKYAGIIRRDIEQNSIQPTEFITDLVGDYEEKQNKEVETSLEDGATETSIKESELLFPLPWNDEQKRIADRLDANYGVVVKGPPGTGKSHTIANLISRFLAQGKTVLVTSQTSKALEVLRDKLPENIRSLAVSQLHQTAKRDDVLQQSITEISSNLGERQTKFSEEKATSVRNELQRVREEKATLANQIRKYILTDSSIKINIDGQDIKPIDAAKLIDKQTSNKELEWLTDQIHFGTELNFTETDLQEAYSFLVELTQEERELYKYELPRLEVLPNEETALEAFASYRDLSTKAKTSDKLFSDSTASFKSEELSVVWEKLSQAKKVLASINENYEKEIFNLCIISQSEREKWQTALVKISERIQLIGRSKNVILGHDVAGNVELSLNDKVEAINILKEKTTSGKIGTFGKLLLSSNAKKILQGYTVDGFAVDNSERVEILREKILAQKAEKEIKTLLEQSFDGLKSSPEIIKTHFDVIQIEVLVASLGRIVNYITDFAEIDEFCKKTKQLSDFSYVEKEHIEKVIEITASSVARFELSKLEELFVNWIETIIESITADPHLIVQKLAVAIEKRNSTGYKNALSELLLLSDQKKKAIKLNMLNQKIGQFAPNLYREVVGFADQKQEFECPSNLGLAWKIVRLQSWLNSIHDHVSIDELQNQLERLTKREYQLNSEIVTILAWQRQIDKVTKRQRDALMAWSVAMKKYGKGTGKYSIKWLRSAQESLKEAKNAVPVWIMPLHRAAQMFAEPKPGMFDVVIFDEASQCDLRGLTIGYLGKKLLIVGDPDQISPAGIFQDLEKGFELISRFLYDIPHKDTFSITSSLFTLAQIRIPNMIQLNEHFRCVPDIIAFSNYHIYEGKLKPLRYPNPRGLLKPALVPVLIEKGYQNTNNKVNEPEARAVVEKLVECLKDPKYQKRPDGRLCTFGIISLLAEDQAKYIERLIRDLVAKGLITEQEIEERRIECGDAYKFQGDERDVMLLSMVRSLDPNNLQDTVAPLVNEDAKRRFNVAASRARDQMFLFHSIPLESFGNKNDWRYKLLNWFYDPKKEDLKAGREALKKEFDSGRASQFSVDVGNLLIDKGYQVLPEYPVIGYRIDLVVQGEDSRLAVECDGDQYHTLENWEEDQVREKQLRRAGWEFWRVTGSAFYLHKEKSLDSLWEKLNEMGIKPII
ncbi:MAG: hypothetical protein A2958_01400 [Candidatus Levybacteria bacterium RIFCSPLOWO2_01_FULL_38_13]|nr:MAG: hypothetical protein A2958_01400 [Candidatus Levybacteria bacterium RIFCSPLOWO2_01_FULL_38_13]